MRYVPCLIDPTPVIVLVNWSDPYYVTEPSPRTVTLSVPLVATIALSAHCSPPFLGR